MRYDIVILGSGPAGLSAAVAARGRNKSVLVVGNRWQDSPLARAECVDNYLGLPSMTGAELMERFTRHAEESGANLVTGKVISLMAWEGFHLTVGNELYEGSSLILAPGVVRQAKYPGEMEYLGRGVSYCATCDGMLYRGKKVAVIGLSADAPEEAEFLRSIGCEVEYFDAARAKKYEIRGSQRVEALIADGTEYAVECVFILRAGVAPGSLVPGLELEGPHIKVNADMATSVPGVFAAGDCVGAPYQVGKAVGEGNIAGISAAKYVENTHEEE